MAKNKSFAVKISYTVEEILYVEAPKASVAYKKGLDPKVYREAHAYDGCDECYCPIPSLPKNAVVVEVREV